jgi:zinc transport system substrate-binding protein
MPYLSSRLAAALFAAAALAFGSPSQAAGSEGPRVVASVPPVHSLVARVMQGVGNPVLLIPGTVSPHLFSLRPSDARTLSHADLVVWVGPALETSLRQPLTTLAANARLVTLTETPDIGLLAVREGGVWGTHAHGEAAADGHDDHHDKHHDADHPAHDAETDHHGAKGGHHDGAIPAAEIDAHIWLSTDNAGVILRAVADALIAQDPDHAVAYAANRDAALQENAALAERLRASLAPVHTLPFVVLHDGYQYFEQQFGLNAVGTISISPDIRPGAQRIGALRDAVRERQARCIFGEPQLATAQARTVAEGTGARIGVLDPIGAGLEPGPGLYPQLMTGLSASIAGCLAAEG